MLVAALMFTASLALLLKSSDWFTDKTEILGKRFGVSPFIIGVTIVAMGTSLPELASSVMAVLNNSSEIIFGNVVGSNIANILLIMGISSLFLKREKKIEWNLFHADITFVIASTVILGVVIWDGAFTLGEMLLLLAGFAIYFTYNYDIHKRNGKRKEKGKRPEFKLWDGAVLIASLALIAVSADVLIKSAVALSQITGIGTEIVGLTAIAIGTSLPELAVSILSLIHI